MSISMFETIIAGIPACTAAIHDLAIHSPAIERAAIYAAHATPDPGMVEFIRYAGFVIMALGVIVIFSRWWRNR